MHVQKKWTLKYLAKLKLCCIALVPTLISLISYQLNNIGHQPIEVKKIPIFAPV